MPEPKPLDALRRLYGGPDDPVDAQMFDPSTRAFLDASENALPYGGPATLLDAPYRPEAGQTADFAGLQVALIGVPMDLGVTNRAGARLGPNAVRAIESVGPYEHVLKMAPAASLALADIGDAPLSSRFSLEACHRDIQSFYTRLRQAGVTPLSVGGDHSITLPILKGLFDGRPLGLVHFDAHCDTSGAFEGSRFHHGGPFRQAVLDGVVDPRRAAQIGIRGNSEFLWGFSRDAGMTVIHAEEVMERGLAEVAATIRRVVGDGPVYVSFDIDCLDPAFAPGTGTPEVGGLATREALHLLRALNGLDVIGADVVEVAPQYDPTTNTARAAAQFLFEMLCLAATAIGKR